MSKLAALILVNLCIAANAADQGKSWILPLTEHTGIERRDNEVVRFVARFAAGEARTEQLRVLDEESRELPVQVVVSETYADSSIKSAEILFPATIMPGRLPRFRLLASPLAPAARKPGEQGGEYQTNIVIRRLGISRIELGNQRFGIIINLGKDNTTPAIVEAYNRTAGEYRMLNLVETTPDEKEKLAFGTQSAGWGTALTDIPNIARTSGFTGVEVLESGPLRARLRLK